ncbi:DUF6616 family protein [Segetibacter sp.]|jgi:hypothetical protein|uniref:DUF6616 family protein n=1 Tax=Segetibacter sp. TaxID=2231182 RepID=UPI00261D344C|nr:DUF6616 family protein [Segetibacter sp.]MCW3081219.1 hypothetical protein [Segetibacter sp.]
MKMYLELWRAKAAWKDLSKEERGNYMNLLGPAIQQLLDNDVKIISWGVNDSSTFNRADYDFFAVWTFPNDEAAQSFEKMVDGAGWYNYFEQVNAKGDSSTPQEVIGKMIDM